MRELEIFLTSQLNPTPRPGFIDQAWEKVAMSYDHSHHFSLKWLLPIPIIVALSVVGFMHVSSDLKSTHDVTQIDQETQQLEVQLKQDPAITEILNMSN